MAGIAVAFGHAWSIEHLHKKYTLRQKRLLGGMLLPVVKVRRKWKTWCSNSDTLSHPWYRRRGNIWRAAYESEGWFIENWLLIKVPPYSYSCCWSNRSRCCQLIRCLLHSIHIMSTMSTGNIMVWCMMRCYQSIIDNSDRPKVSIVWITNCHCRLANPNPYIRMAAKILTMHYDRKVRAKLSSTREGSYA